jgi:hypothetical protein
VKSIRRREKAMNAEVEADLAGILQRLKAMHESDLPEQFISLCRTVIIPALQEIAERIKANGHDCKVDEDIEEPISDLGQSIHFVLDTRYTAGPQTLCFRLLPGESLVQIEIPAGGATVLTRQMPFNQITADHVQRLAIDFLKQLV